MTPGGPSGPPPSSYSGPLWPLAALLESSQLKRWASPTRCISASGAESAFRVWTGTGSGMEMPGPETAGEWLTEETCSHDLFTPTQALLLALTRCPSHTLTWRKRTDPAGHLMHKGVTSARQTRCPHISLERPSLVVTNFVPEAPALRWERKERS